MNGIEIYGGTIFAGAKHSDNCSAIGGGGNGYGSVYISGGTVTAVTSSTGTAIGGGIGWSSAGGEGYVEITDGTVYAYNHCFYGSGYFVPATAIGGASSHTSSGTKGTVKISGGTVYAQCTGGTAIGGGGSTNSSGGAADVTISNLANVTAKSVAGTVGTGSSTYNASAGTSIGGGTGSSAGGNVTFKMTGGTLKTGSVGGGKRTETSNAYGSGTVTIEGGTINGQFVLSPTSSGNCSFTMKGGTIGGKLDGFTYMQPDGYAVWMNDSGGTVTINQSVGTSKITGCTGAGNGGAIYMLAGTFTLTAGTIEKCSAINGGAVYMGGGTFNMNGGTIGGTSSTDGNKAIGSSNVYGCGGGIYMGGGTFTMKGGSITYNETTKNTSYSHGGGIYIASGGTVTIHGGTISNNTAKAYGGGFYVNPGASATTTIDNVNANTTISDNKARYGAGAFIETGTINVSSTNSRTTTISGNIADQSGGGLYVKGTANLTGVKLNGNKANGTADERGGGGLYVTGNYNNSISGGEVKNNYAENKGGGVYVNAGNNYTLTISGTVQMNNNEANYGAGAYIAKGKLAVTGTNASNLAHIESNTATTDGGGVYAAAGSVTISNASINSNTATSGNGGGIYAVGAVTVTGGTVSSNHADNTATDCGLGGGIYALAGSGNTIKVQTSATVGSNTAKQGAGIYAASGAVEVNSSTLSGNVASSDGGAIYGGGGNITVSGGSIATNTATNGNGGGVYATSGTITFNSSSKAAPSFTGNTANNGGVLYMEGGTCNINAGTLGGSHADRNKAIVSGGAIYVDDGTVNFATGTISYNTAGTSGGGLFVATNGTLKMTGDVTLNYNHVPADKLGGGIYLEGVVSIGASTARTVNAQYNFAAGTVDTDPSTVTINATNRNNVYLPVPTVNSGHKDVITVIQNGLTTSTRVGFSVPSNFVPVIYCNESSPYTFLKKFLTPIANGGMKETVFDDAEKYSTVHYDNNSFYDAQHIYLSGGTWVDHVSTYTIANPPAGFSVSGNNVTISSNEGLAWLVKYINGISPYTSSNATVNVTLTANVDMGDYAWVPIASTGATSYSSSDVVFAGTFNGNGYKISNLICQHLGTQTGSNLGLFGTVGNNATVKNVQLKDARLNTESLNSGSAYLGAIAGQTTGGTIQNCVADVDISTLYNGTVMGGLVGKQSGGTVHSCYAMPELTGYQMGGLIGELTGGNLFNSFVYAKFTSKSNTHYQGGLVGVNNGGTVENCYSHEQTGSSHGSYYGSLVGNNASGTVAYCYSATTPYKAAGNNPTGHGLYADNTSVPYLYKHRDNQVTVVTPNDNPFVSTNAEVDKQMLLALNNWVTLENEKTTPRATCTFWMRPTTKYINNDLPLLLMPATNSVAATNGDIYLDYGWVNNHIANYTGNTQAICFYGNENAMVSNSGSSAGLNFYEHAVMKQADNNTDIIATVGISLDNSAGAGGANPTQGGSDAIDWHMFSTSLSNAPLGVNYLDNEEHPFNWGAPPTGMNLYQFYDDATHHGYFPSHVYGTDYATQATPTADGINYYYDWDYYTYYEPEYHWINFKRNGNSHWHEDYPTVKINYKSNGTGSDWTNETTLIKGRGYLVATKEPTYLQCSGTLTKGNVSVNVTASAWVRTGYNLLGNPYQSYLDFNQFAQTNKALWGITGTDYTKANYFILDEDQKGYIKYAYGASANSYTAPMYLHPHQGFMVITKGAMAVQFTEAMRNTTATGVTFRGGESAQPAYPLVNLIATEGNGNRDVCTVELGRPDKGGAPVQREMRVSNGLIYCRYDDDDWGIAFTQPGVTELPIRFETAEDTEYTMTWDTENGDFHYLHLIDNMTGADVDCLSATEYRFSAKTDDYASRFRLVFGYTGIEEPEVPEPVEGTTPFAFQMGDELVVNGSGTLEVIDLLGRVVRTERLDGTQSVIALPDMAKGVYVLRLSTQNGTRTQKIVLK